VSTADLSSVVAGAPSVGEAPTASVVVPVLNEAHYLPEFLEGLSRGIERSSEFRFVEAILVDDGSTDGSQEIIRRFGRNGSPVPIQLVERGMPTGPASAELAGCKLARGDFVVKLDGDGQHDPALIPMLLDATRRGSDIAIASRYADGGANDWPALRGLTSRTAVQIAKVLLPGARRVRDPLSGYFVVRAGMTKDLDLGIPKYKLLLYILTKHPHAAVREIPFIMRTRLYGESKVVGRSPGFALDFLREVLRYFRLSVQQGNNGHAPTGVGLGPELEGEPAASPSPSPQGPHGDPAGRA